MRASTWCSLTRHSAAKSGPRSLFFEKGEATRQVWYLDPGRTLGKTNPLNDAEDQIGGGQT
ncbi:hypothetical protein LZ016_10560 [Sphingomonas sp. SM33]|uniref:Uncharacterized protein n=1 Tax=Sphingomonas telluris TaxID=2907998 RepID=A0ABS9VPU2_9SPHN|nr:hypothetical protein [Sphingomonas telluris]MCH8616539.1 hypothetical protein [Sphingomonas telluris]